MNAPDPRPGAASAPQLPVAPPRTTPPAPPIAPEAAPRHQHRTRDFGIGYGNSSGYGCERHYGDGHADPIFRCV